MTLKTRGWGTAWVVAMGALGGRVASPSRAATPEDEVAPLRDAAVAAIARARAGARAAANAELLREVTLPSIERLVEDADSRRGSITVPARDWDFVHGTLETARAYADRVAAGEDPYRTATGTLVKAYGPTGTGRSSPTRSMCREVTTRARAGRW
jgi:hypothetical protein